MLLIFPEGFGKTLTSQNGKRGVYYKTWVDKIGVAVEETFFKIRIEEPGPAGSAGTLPIKVIAERKEGFNGQINVRAHPPAGPELHPPLISPPTKTRSPMCSTATVPRKFWSINWLSGHGHVDGATAYVSTQLSPLEIKDYFMVGKIMAVTTTQGYPTELKVDLTTRTEFPGEATVELVGLPTGTTSTKLQVTKDTESITFPISVEPNARVARTAVYCKLSMDHSGHQVTQIWWSRYLARECAARHAGDQEAGVEASEDS